jgi:DGQHR domain-containing protein
MEATIIETGRNHFLDVELTEFVQKQHSIYLGKIKADDFLKIYTVRPAKYDLDKHTALANSFPDEGQYYDHLIKEDKLNLEAKDFQRDANEARVNQVANFLNEEEYAFFPNTIIANCELINDSKNYDLTENHSLTDFLDIEDKPDYLSFLRKEGSTYKLAIPYRSNSILVIDGQHRLKGLEECEEYVRKDYDLLVAFVIGFDRSIIAKQFYTINYEQKPVNRSLLIQLTGEFSRDINELSFMHNVVKLLNEIEESPFFGRVKMLGTTPKNLPTEQKRMLSISQAFLVDAMIRFVSTKAVNTNYPPIFLKYYCPPPLQRNQLMLEFRPFFIHTARGLILQR